MSANHCDPGASNRTHWEQIQRARQPGRTMLSLGTLALVAFIATGCGGGASIGAGQAHDAAAAPTVAMGVIGAPQEGDGLAVSIDALRTTDACGMVDLDPSTAEIDTEELAPGHEFLVLTVTIENVGDAPHEFNAFGWTAMLPGNEAPYPAALLAVTGYDLTADDLEPGESRSGDVVIAIPADASAATLTYATQLFAQGAELSWDVNVG